MGLKIIFAEEVLLTACMCVTEAILQRIPIALADGVRVRVVAICRGGWDMAPPHVVDEGSRVIEFRAATRLVTRKWAIAAGPVVCGPGLDGEKRRMELGHRNTWSQVDGKVPLAILDRSAKVCVHTPKRVVRWDMAKGVPQAVPAVLRVVPHGHVRCDRVNCDGAAAEVDVLDRIEFVAVSCRDPKFHAMPWSCFLQSDARKTFDTHGTIGSPQRSRMRKAMSSRVACGWRPCVL